MASTNNKNTNTITILEQATLLFAGDSGDGMQLTGTEFTHTAARLGNEVSTLPDFPAEIRAPAGTVAGVSGFQLHFGSVEIKTPGDECDVLIAMNAAAVKKYLKSLHKNGILIANVSGFDSKNLRLANYDAHPLEDLRSEYQVHEIDISKQTHEALKGFELSNKDKERCKNMFALGFVYWLYSKPLDFSLDFLASKFGADSLLFKANQKALKVGYQYGEITETFAQKFEVPKAEMPPGEYRNVSGNEAIALGLLAASVQAKTDLFFGGYPITPASDILHHLNTYRGLGVKLFQAEDEIAAITSAIGASYAGALGITATSGPGMSLKTEALGLACMLEIPLVVVNVQRGGPSTGLPTKTEQADLLQALYGRNGEAPIPVFAPKSPSDCFDMAFLAGKVALEHNTPVILLSDGYLANGAAPWRYPQTANLPSIHPKRILSKEENQTPYLPYQRDENGVRTLAFPGMKGLEHRLGGLEKQENTGEISYDGDNHEIMVKQRQAKVDKIAAYYPKTLLALSAKEAECLIISWGSTFGSVNTAVKQLIDQGQKVAHLHLNYLYPMPKDLGEIVNAYTKIIIPEMNNGQLIHLIRDTYLVEAMGINKIQGAPFKTSEIYTQVLALITPKENSMMTKSIK